ncbi:MAG: ATP-binding protein [Chloroflexota bacterium]
MWSANVMAESLPRLLDKKPEMVRSGLEDIHQLTKSCLVEVRTLLFELRPNALIETDLSELLEQLTKAFSGRTQIPVLLSIDSEIDLPSSQKIGVYRIAQEALANVARHANAQQVWLEFHNNDSGYALIIRDDGIGFNLNETPSGHLGIQIMRERAEEMNARLTIESRLSIGTSIRLFS